MFQAYNAQPLVQPLSNNSDKIVVPTRCKSCKIKFTRATILKNISHYKPCWETYTQEELLLLKEWPKEKKAEIKKKLYDPGRRRQKYLEQKRKMLEQKEQVISIIF